MAKLIKDISKLIKDKSTYKCVVVVSKIASRQVMIIVRQEADNDYIPGGYKCIYIPMDIATPCDVRDMLVRYGLWINEESLEYKVVIHNYELGQEVINMLEGLTVMERICR
jgi:hypothetical protein